MRKINVMTICKSCNSVFDGQHLKEKCPSCGEELAIAGTGLYVTSAFAAHDMIDLAMQHASHEFENLLDSLEEAGWVYEPTWSGFRSLKQSKEEATCSK
jgi:tRNA G26 N,N-dimethylase Trm1